ncbi:MAG: NfeD family protein [Acidobacteria bacterium]|nr:NfeD family protein [Acidobacteriota bacterium]
MSALVISLLVLSAPAVALAAYVVHASRQQKYSRLPLNLVGRVASVERTLEPEGFVLIEGELWRARARGGEAVVRGGLNVRVVGAGGCVLLVEPLERARPSSRNEGAAFLEESGAASSVARELL